MLRFIGEPGFLACSRAEAQTMRTGLVWHKVADQYLALYELLLGDPHRRLALAER